MAKNARRLAIGLALFVLGFVGRDTLGEPKATADLKAAPEGSGLRVALCDATELEADALDRILFQASGIYSSVGVQIVWIECGQIDGARARPDEAIAYILRHLPRPHRKGENTLACVFGYQGHPPGPIIYVSRDAVEEFARGSKSLSRLPPGAVARAYGRVLAHELAHRFLQRSDHTRTGILKEKFSREELIAVLPTGFFLTKEQAQFLRSLVPTAVGREVPSSW